ncbi:serine hydrolase [Allonocardiopsis opalescens]|uniref:Beta-lactamase n=1 Tax=Allonocardiopsis opalescens TaxID=1144618 RepID=A0A2T0Q9Z7_9ACTN|nr:serine hydrolase [Allonocardiopsis opalescens]PRY00719.1 beta-lactamase class A [Allonocardiopsis opalescens]
MPTEARLLAEVTDLLDRAGLRAGICVRDLETGREIALDADRAFPLASVVKLPLVMALLIRHDRGDGPALDDAVDIDPAHSTTGPGGLSRFRRPARIAVDDLMYLAMCVSDNAAGDELFRLCPPEEVTAALRKRGHRDITVRHLVDDLQRSVAERLGDEGPHLALALAIRSATRGGGDVIPQLDVARANVGTARALTDLLADIWSATGPWAVRLRELMAANMLRQRLAPDLESDVARWSSKAGTFLTLRHEAGVLEHEFGDRYAIAVLSESSVPARAQPAADAALGEAARLLHRHLRSLNPAIASTGGQ